MADKTYQTTLLIRGDSSNAVRSVQLTRDELEKLTGAQKKNATMTDSLAASWNKANNFTKQHSADIKLLGAAVVGGMAYALKSVVDYSDQYKQLQGQLKLVTGSQEELNQVYTRALTLSNATGASIESTVNLYARMARSTEELGLSQDELFTITKAVNQSFVVSGASAQEADSAILQLSQGLAAGALRGEELNSVMENSPRLARALADGLGVTIGQLREMGKNGELTADAVTGALLRMSDSIDAEFQQMPITVARATNEIKNQIADAFGKADLSPLVESVQSFGAVLKDPAVIDGLTTMASKLVEMATAAAKAVAVLPSLTTFLAEGIAAAAGGPAADDLVRMSDQIDLLSRRLKLLKEQGAELTPQYIEMAAELDKLNKVYNLQLELSKSGSKAKKSESAAVEDLSEIYVTATRIAAENTRQTEAAIKAAEKLEKAKKKTQDQIDKNTESFRRAHSELDSMVRKTEDYIRALEFETAQTTRSAREQAIENDVRAAGTRITEEQTARIREASAAKYDAQLAAETLAEAEKEAARASEQAWSDARNTLSNFFFEMAADGKNAFDTLVDGFRAMLSKMIAEAAANKILLAVGIGGASGSAAASAGASSIASSAGGFFSGLGGSITAAGQGLYESIGTFASNNGFTGFGDAAYTKGLNTSLSTIGLDVGGGLLGGYLGNQAFGSTSGLGSAAGGILGSIAIPIPGLGAAVGSFVGAGIEKGIEKLFGGKNDGNNKGYSVFDLGTGSITAAGVGKSFDAENVSASQSLAEALQQFAGAIGGSRLAGSIYVGGKDGIAYDGRAYGNNTEAFLRDAFEDVIEGADNLSDGLKPLLLDFEGTAAELADFAQVLYGLDQASGGVNEQMISMLDRFEGTTSEMVGFAAAVATLQGASGINTATEAVRDFNRAQLTSAQAYEKHSEALRREISLFDGSADAAGRMAQMLIENKNAAYDFVTALQSVGESLADKAAGQAQSIRDSVLTDEQLFTRRLGAIAVLIDALERTTDPEKAAEIQSAILDLNQAAFDSLSEDQKITYAEDFAGIAESTNATFQQGLKDYIDGVEITAEELNTRVIGALEKAAGDQQAAANTSLRAGELMMRAAELMRGAVQPGTEIAA